MLILVDGHNLIPKIPGLSLRDENDELQLIELLQTYARVNRKKVEVYFDRAAPGRAGKRRFGTVTAHFVPESGSADQAIRVRLEKSGRENRDIRVVSSDRAVQNSARLNRSQAQSSEDFARELVEASVKASQVQKSSREAVSEEELTEWLRIFNAEQEEGKGRVH